MGKNYLGKEVEFKWRIRSGRDEGRFLAVSRKLGAHWGPPDELRLRDIYLDTPDFLLARSGMNCRVRRISERQKKIKFELTLKARNPLKNGMAARREMTLPFPGGSSFPAALKKVKQALAVLSPELAAAAIQFEIMNRRTARILILDDGTRAEAGFDRVKIVRGKRIVRMREIELEFGKGLFGSYKRFATELTRVSGLTFQTQSKVATAVSAFRLHHRVARNAAPPLRRIDLMRNFAFIP